MLESEEVKTGETSCKFSRRPHFIVWDNSDLVIHEVMGGLKNVYAIWLNGQWQPSPTKVLLANLFISLLCTLEMIFITHLVVKDLRSLRGPCWLTHM
ncbi:hypothetical protein Nepgr_030533 [Nepenthes gracilis]|uniref:Uncharacterized protein n=1 Tax=Nepenthes gracilis TaxID=150966 RepID=A0AAD3TFH7_NEPGR|nr:hypothetical protein Nepgr_030533 [Nepenthes gracilis]